MNENIKLLLVEDEWVLATVVAEFLQMQKMEVVHASDGQKGLELYRSFKPDICVVDIVLPKKSGIALVKEIRNEDTLIPLIFLSAKTEVSDILEGFRVGGNDYIKKPFSVQELVQRIYALVKSVKTISKPHPTNNEICIGSYVFNYMKQELRYNEEATRLSLRESEIPKTLVENQNMIHSRKEILIKLWGDDSLFNSRSLDVYITKIRKYLLHDKNIQIINIKGRGYILVSI